MLHTGHERAKRQGGGASHARRKIAHSKTEHLWTDFGKLGLHDYKIPKKTWFVNHSRDFFGGEGRHLSGRVKITPGEWILRLPHPNGECCQNFVSNTANDYMNEFSIKNYYYCLYSFKEHT